MFIQTSVDVWRCLERRWIAVARTTRKDRRFCGAVFQLKSRCSLENVYYTQVCMSSGAAPKVWESASHRNGFLEGVARVAFSRRGLQGSQKISVSLRSCVATLHFGGYGTELQSHATLANVVNKLPHTLRSRWAEYSFAIMDRLLDLSNLVPGQLAG